MKRLALTLTLLASSVLAQDVITVPGTSTAPSRFAPGTQEYRADMIAKGWTPHIHPQTGVEFWSKYLDRSEMVAIPPRESDTKQLCSGGS